MPSSKTANGIFLIDDSNEVLEESRKHISANFNLISKSIEKVNNAENKFDSFKTSQEEAFKTLQRSQTEAFNQLQQQQQQAYQQLLNSQTQAFDQLKTKQTEITQGLVDTTIHKYGLGDTGSQPLTNLDDMNTPQGFYKTIENVTTGTFPAQWGGKAKWANVVVERLDINWIKQTITEISEDGTPLIYYRTNRHSNNTWHPWVFLMNEKSLVNIDNKINDVTNTVNTAVSNKLGKNESAASANKLITPRLFSFSGVIDRSIINSAWFDGTSNVNFTIS